MSFSVPPPDLLRENARATTLAVTLIVVAVTYQFWLALVHTNLTPVSPALFAAIEIAIFLGAVPLLFTNLRPAMLLVVIFIVVNLSLIALLRGGVDFKGARDIAIVIIFYWVGSNVGSIQSADKLLTGVTAIVVVVALIEWWFVDFYTQFLDIFSYYLSLGRLDSTAAAITGQRLNLNGIRPEGIGRTILPAVFGSHRISSVFLEPVSLGNFAVMLAAWGFSKNKEQIRKTIFFVSTAAFLIALSDSRYGLTLLGLLAVFRLVIKGKDHLMAILFPVFGIVLVIGVATFFQNALGEDDVLGRLAWTGQALKEFDPGMLIGWKNPIPNYADMGYAYVISRFGLILCIFLWLAFWLLPIRDIPGVRFRAYIALYIVLNLTVSGTSLFALKTAGILWFLIGCHARLGGAMSAAENPRRSLATSAGPGFSYAN